MGLGKAASHVIYGFILAQSNEHGGRFHDSRIIRAAAQDPASLNDTSTLCV
ncbi:hypothetical protein ACGF5F_16275 [Streptomyces sp. NPDC047821]|uniref:hypothetical protein n=1 Tax=Streptomyces sp. NPDC047821 TaxID=3365488 RepID=UPI00371F11F5